VTADEDGKLWAVWEAETGGDVDLAYSRWDGKEWSPPLLVHHRPAAWDRSPSLAIAADGTPWLVWASSERDAPGTSLLQVSRWTGNDWTDPEQVPLGAALAAKEPVLASGPDGRPWLAWVGFDGNDDEVFASHWNGKSWSLPRQVNADDKEPDLYDRQPHLAVGRDGQPWVVWTGHQSGPDDEIYASHWDGSGWTPEVAVSHDDDSLDVSPSLALDALGQPWVAWKGRANEGNHSRLRIFVSHWQASSANWTDEMVVGAPLSQAVDEEDPLLIRDPRDSLHLTWTVTGAPGTAFASSVWQDGLWDKARLVRAPAPTDAALVPLLHDEAPSLLWLDPTADTAPFRWSQVDNTSQSLSAWLAIQTESQPLQGVGPIVNRYLAFGDSITCIPDCFGPNEGLSYPEHLDAKLDLRVAPSEVVQAGKSGEGTYGGSERITGQVSTHLPKYVLAMEGTNDVTREKVPADVYDNLVQMIENATVAAGVDDVSFMLATIIPRLDNLNDATLEMNTLAVIPAAAAKGVPVCDQWRAFYDTGALPYLFEEDDETHPNYLGREVIADAFYDCLLATYPELEEESNPPTAWIESVPTSFECGGSFPVSWNGTDDLSWVVDYDVQVRAGDAEWTDWLLGAPQMSQMYSDTSAGRYGDAFGFRVRARDLVGNQGEYSAPAYTTVADSVPPYEAHVDPLPDLQVTPFDVSWWGSDACADVVAFDTQYRVGTDGDWQDWLTATPEYNGGFAPPVPQSGETYYFRVRAQDAAGNWGAWSEAETSTELIAYTLAGHVYNTRHQPVVAAVADLAPTALHLLPRGQGSFVAYLGQAADYDVSVARDDRYGTLPTTYGIVVDGHVDGPEFILPPQDDIVNDGDFEGGSLDAWQLAGTAPPSPSTSAHSGLGAVQMGSVGHDSSLAQVISPGSPLDGPTFSLLVRLSEAGPAGSLSVELTGSGVISSPLTHTIPVESVEWKHVWHDLPGVANEPLTLTLTIVDAPAVLVDEVRLGSTIRGGYPVYLPILYRE
jgi:lysophospholipase L1-like esterase